MKAIWINNNNSIKDLKKFRAILISLFLIGLINASCSKKTTDSGDQTGNSIVYNQKVYNLYDGYLEYYKNIPGTGYNIDLTLISPGLTVVRTNGIVDSIVGTGSGINFELFSSNSKALEVGDYTYDASKSGAPGTFDYANAIFNFDTSTGEGTTLDMNGGTVIIKNNGSEYELTFNCTAVDGKRVTGNYKGSLTYYLKSGSLKSAKLSKKHLWYKNRDDE